MMSDANDMDLWLARVGTRAPHPGLDMIDDAILRGIAQDRRRQGAPIKLGFVAAVSAVAAAAIGGGATMAAAEPPSAPPALMALGSASLAPSTLLATE
jgi:hypothetical protein